ncbi:BA75_02677T0 [Komagataella pastoris]|uniref:dolichol kinase n=1 Tax=Komagataella pastoris TaxID=4922 RepID=A0A1B2JDH2_PICPA|nr:BA75_02677T0 [Komagataella pastoris]
MAKKKAAAKRPKKTLPPASSKPLNSEEKSDEIQEEYSGLPPPQLSFKSAIVAEMTSVISNGITINKIIQVLILAYIANLLYVKLDLNFDYDSKIEVGIGFLSILSSILIIYVSRKRRWNTGVELGSIDKDDPEKWVQLPEFNLIYAIVLPIFVTYIVDKRYLGVNLVNILLVIDIPIVFKILLALSMEQQVLDESGYLNQGFVTTRNNLLIPIAHVGFRELLGYYGGSSFSNTESELFSTLFVNLVLFVDKSNIELFILAKLTLAFIGSLVICTALYRTLNLFSPKYLTSLILHPVFTALVYYGSVYQLTPVLGKHPWDYLVNDIMNEQRIHFLYSWLILLVVVVPPVFYFVDAIPLDLRRKIWHFTILIILSYPLSVDPSFCVIALGGVFGLFLVIEILRSTEMPPFGQILSRNLERFQDERDKRGNITISYLYLVLGIVLPVMFDGSSCAGLVSLGLGDAMASLVGKHYGLVKWPGSNKSVEGTFAFIVVTFLGLSAARTFFGYQFSWEISFIAAALAGVLEGISDFNDNIIIPLVVFTILHGQ